MTGPVLADWMTPITAASEHSAADRAPAEVALLGVCGAVVIAVAAGALRRGRLLRGRAARAPMHRPARAPKGRQARASTYGPAHARPYVLPDDAELRAGPAAVVPGPQDAEPTPVARRAAVGTPGRNGAGAPRATVLVSAAVATVLAVGAAAAAVLVHAHGTASPRSVVAVIDPAQRPDPAIIGAPGASRADSPSADPSRSAARKPASHATSASAGPKASSSPAQPAGTLSAPAAVEMTAVEAGETYTASVTITAEDGPVQYTASEPVAEDADYTLTIGSPTGTLASGDSQTLTVTVSVIVYDVSDPPYISLSPGGATVTLAYPPLPPAPVAPCPPTVQSIGEVAPTQCP